jgi:DNA helicase II / ATP-dependent DNA helicase PcrA
VKRWDEDLVDPARRIAEIQHSPLRVLAGPGTGKTFAMMRRVARLLQGGAMPSRIFICSFARTAAADLKESVLALGEEGVENIKAGTLHSYCFELLSRNQVLRLTGRVPRPLLEFEERFLLEDISGGVLQGVSECKKRLKAFNAAWSRLQTEQPGWCEDPIDREFDSKLKSWLRFHQGMLIGEVVPEALNYLRQNPAAAERDHYHHVLLDEYQDLNRAEQEFLSLLAEGGTLTVIGDENQSIYSFKHAHPEGISTFHERFPATHDENLVECRRCPKLVVDMANRLISQNSNRTDRELKPRDANPVGEVVAVQWTTVKDEAEGIAKFIRSQIESGKVTPGQVLVLATRKVFGFEVRDALLNLETPAHSFFNEEALVGNPGKQEDCQAAEAFTLLSLLANPEDRVSLRCWCGFGSPSLRAGAWRRLREHCEVNGGSPRDVLSGLASGELKVTNCSDLLNRYMQLEARLGQLKELSGQKLMDLLFPPTQAWAEPIHAIYEGISRDDAQAGDLLEHLRTGITQPELPTDVDYIRVMSLYKSKGLTAQMVVIVGCVEGAIPRHHNDLPPVEQQANLEEQRRLFYVAITRPTQTLVISSFTQMPRDISHTMRIPLMSGGGSNGGTLASTFIRELGPSCPHPISGQRFLSKTQEDGR